MKKLLLLLFVCPLLFVSCSDDDTEITKESNEKISDIKFSKNEIGVNQKIILTVESNLTDQNFEWYANDVKLPEYGTTNTNNWQPKKKGEYEIKVIGKNEKVEDVIFTKKITVIDCDFGVAIWGDNREIIIASESGWIQTAENTTNLIYNLTGNRVRTYAFKGGNSLSMGVESVPYVIAETGVAKLEVAALKYMAIVSSLESTYGKYLSSDMDRYDLATEIGRRQMGAVIFNGVSLETKFENNKSNIICYVDLDSSVSFNVVTEFTKK